MVKNKFINLSKYCKNYYNFYKVILIIFLFTEICIYFIMIMLNITMYYLNNINIRNYFKKFLLNK